MADYDLIIERGNVIDGTGSPAELVDIGICGNKIYSLGSLGDAHAARRLNASGLVVSPGFIDMHSHSEIALMADGRGESMLLQGVTTNVTGNCGDSPAPITDQYRYEVEPGLGISQHFGINFNWNSFADFLKVYQEKPKAINNVPLVGHGTIRSAVMGLANRQPTYHEIKQMQDLTRKSMSEGAFGISTGLITPPGMYSDIEELTAVIKTVAEFDGIYSSHIRGETASLIKAVEEIIQVGRDTGVRCNISHHKAVGRNNWGKVRSTYKMISKAADDIDITYDMYPYHFCGGSLSQYLPPWAKEGGQADMFARLSDPVQRLRIGHDIIYGCPGFANFYPLHWEDIQISNIKEQNNIWMEGLRISEIAEVTGKNPIDLIMDIIIEEHNDVPVNQYILSESDIEFLLPKPHSMIGSDGWALTPGGLTGMGKPHPRSYGAFARVIGLYVREKKILDLTTAIHKMTGKPSAKLKLKDRGLIKEGYAADIIVFDQNCIKDRATDAEPHRFAEGLHWVIVNGHLALDKGCVSKKLNGKVLSPG